MIGKNLRYLRDKKGLSQTALAEALDLKRGNISSYEKELAQPSIQSLIRISAYFDVSVEDLVKRDLSVEVIKEENLLEKFSHHTIVQNLKGKLSQFATAHSEEKVEKLKSQNKEIAKMIEGFQAFHEYRMKNFSMKKSDIESLSHDYKNLLSLVDTLLKANSDLIKLAER
ncbi:hypothetical protein GCM10027429_07380 [Marivirga atlantica]|jgi:transcriptional regulator with XRE-family HTH domain|uniref:Helix-turn-helix domain-containing protein n=1 Tax=Marivirga atlantica TaxID=1548457 RepID=A0A937ADP3_9BACT|nr:helix-turn-helix transcriptional regulator [Marivirga atlantica]MBL0764348.1 helix-turn-helix domain-containing protein [Marivirga atlantica]